MEAASVALTLAPVAGMAKELAASEARMLARLQVPTQGEEAEQALRALVPQNPLDGGDAPGVEGSGLAALNARAREMGVDIEQLRGEVK
jgi:hypothetical protein